MGTSVFARDILSGLIAAGEDVIAVYTQPDRPSGRGMTLKAPPAKELALAHELPVFQPDSFAGSDAVAELAQLRPDFLLVASYGLLLPQAVLDIPAIAPLNIHASVLPQLRGAAPIQAAIMQYWQPDAKTGVSLMRIVKKMDAGPVYATAEIGINRMTAEELTGALAQAGVTLLLRCLPLIAAGNLEPVPQNETMATYAPKLTKASGLIDWNRPCAVVDAHIRGVTPWPGAQTRIFAAGREIPVQIMTGAPAETADAPAGTLRADKKGLSIACADQWYQICSLKPQGRKITSAADFANGLRLDPGIAGTAN